MSQDQDQLQGFNLHPALIEWEQSRQAEERSGSFEKPEQQFPPSFAERGWDIGEGVIRVVKLTTKKEVDRLIEERKQRIADWEQKGDAQLTLYTNQSEDNVQLSYAELAERSKALWQDEQGNWIRPTHRAIYGYRRGYSLPASVVAYQSYHNTDDVFSVPVTETTVKSDDEEFKQRLLENERLGQVGYTDADMLAIAHRLVRIGESEGDVGRFLNVKRGKAQHLHSVASLARKYPNLNLIPRAKMPHPRDENDKLAKDPIPYTKGGFYPLSSFTAKAARTLLGKVKRQDAMDSMAVEAMGHDEPGKEATQDQVEAFIRILCEGRKNAPKMMDKSTIRTFEQSAPDNRVRDIFNGILENDGVKVNNAVEALMAEIKPAEANA